MAKTKKEENRLPFNFRVVWWDPVWRVYQHEGGVLETLEEAYARASARSLLYVKVMTICAIGGDGSLHELMQVSMGLPKWFEKGF